MKEQLEAEEIEILKETISASIDSTESDLEQELKDLSDALGGTGDDDDSSDTGDSIDTGDGFSDNGDATSTEDDTSNDDSGSDW